MNAGELASQIQAVVVGDTAVELKSCATLEEAGPGQVSFLSNPKYARQLETTRAAAVVVSPRVTSARQDLVLLQAKDPYYAFMQAVVALHGHRKHPHAGIHPQACVDADAIVGEGSVIYPGAYVGPRARLGRECILYPNAVVYDDCILGDRVTLHAGAVIGVDGFGYATHGGVHHKIPQTGNVILEDDVEVGANCTIQRATLGSTVIEKGTKFGDLNDVGHGTRIGAHGLVVGLVGVAGSVVIGHHVVLGGQVGIAGHLKIGDHVTAAGRSGITGSVPDKSMLWGMPAIDMREARRVVMSNLQLPGLLRRVKELEKKVAELTGQPIQDPQPPTPPPSDDDVLDR